MAVAVGMALHLQAGARREPRRERLVGADRERIEAEVGAPRLGRHRNAAGELRHHLDPRVVVGGADEEPRDPNAAELRLRQAEHLKRMLALEQDLALARSLDQHRRGRGLGRGSPRRWRSGRHRLLLLFQLLQPLLHSSQLLLQLLDLRWPRLSEPRRRRQSDDTDRDDDRGTDGPPHTRLPSVQARRGRAVVPPRRASPRG